MKYTIATLLLILLAALNIIVILRLVLESPSITSEEVLEEVEELRSQNLIPELDDVGIKEIVGAVEADAESLYRFVGYISVQNAQEIPVEDAIVTYQFITSSDIQILQSKTDGNGKSVIDIYFNDKGTYRIEVLDITGDGIQLSTKLSTQLNLTQVN